MRETRCQAPLKGTIASYLRPPLDLAYIAGAVYLHGCQSLIIDYPAEEKGWRDFEKDLLSYEPDYLVVNTTSFTVSKDLIACKIAKKINKRIITTAKGAIFYHGYQKVFELSEFLDIAVINDEEMGFGEIASGKKLSEITGIIYRSEHQVIKNEPRTITHLDSLPYPRRELINHRLYKRIDTDEMQTSILIGRGCENGCIFCVAPIVNGNKCRYRSFDSVIEEINLCINNYNINSFTFYSDTFTNDRDWVRKLCKNLVHNNIKINWLCSSRADCIDEETLILMKKAGCWGISIGVESGSQFILDKINKKITLSQVSDTVELCKKHKIVTLLHFMIGFPWDDRNTINDTIRFARHLKSTLVDFNLVTPFPGTPLTKMLQKSGLILDEEHLEGTNYQRAMIKTFYLNNDELEKYRNKAMKSFYLNIFFYINSLKQIKSVKHFIKCTSIMFKKILISFLR
ncbi:MAG: hypothetical protein K0R00_291 [Herbinix sp.]|jgi:radical SAM superfamily enzyme YgiQ (UPF0313 family)|nr:hypothetical protein [Herbinix sp.]